MTYIPKFRITSRLITWIENNYYSHTRLPKNIEEVFFKSKEDPETIVYNLVSYAEKVYQDDLDSEHEEMIKKNPNALIRYIHHVHNRGKSVDHLIESLKGHGSHLAAIADCTGRLPVELEQDIKQPKHFVDYVSNIKSKERIYSPSDKLRIPEMEQAVFLSGGDGVEIAEQLVRYSTVVGKLPLELEALLAGHGSSILSYANVLRNTKQSLSEDLVNSLAGDDENLMQYAQYHLQKRLPNHLEKTMSNPRTLLNYAKNIVRGRLPEELENHFANDYRMASNYAFEVIRGFACVRLPDVVHTAMIMKSCSHPDDQYIKRYVSECEKDTTVSGSW